MPTPSQQRILDSLHVNQGNVKVVAEDLGMSVSIVNRVKKNLWQPQDTAIVPHEPVAIEKAKEAIEEVLPTNFAAVAALRDEAIDKLRELVNNGLVDARDLTNIANAILKYEREVYKVVTPAVGVLNDNRQIHFNGLVDKLTELSPEALRVLSGVPNPVVIDMEAE